MKAKEREDYEYAPCAKPITITIKHRRDDGHRFILEEQDTESETATVECIRPDGHDGECKPTIPFADFKVIATARTTRIRI